MTPRLFSIVSFVRHGASVIDVGTDHAYVPVFLAKNRSIKAALATDLKDGPLARARENINQYGLAEKILTKKACGLQNVDVTAYDTIIIAGMGGELIADILHHAPDLNGKELILQPMTAMEELRRYLAENGYQILEEKLSREGDKIYVTMHVKKGDFGSYSPLMYRLGKETKKDPLYPILFEQEKSRLLKQLSGLKKARSPQQCLIEKIQELLGEMENDNENL